MAKRTRLRRDSSPNSESDNESSSDSNSNSDSDSNDSSEAEPEPRYQRRKDLRWLHAGLFKDAKGATKDVWYAFKKNKWGRYQIIYASDWMGTSFKNLNVGRRKSDLITWDKHHFDKWSRFITSRGTWVRKRAMVGRAVQRDTLLQTWLDPNSPNHYRHGKEKDRNLGPPLNVIHTTDDYSSKGSVPIPVVEVETGPEECYPATTIPLSTIRIAVGAFREYDKNPLTVIADFLTGQLARHVKFRHQKTGRNDQIESAFYDCGWRINRRALEKTNDSILLGKVENAFQSKSWRREPPLWVDRFKGDKLNIMITQMRDDMGEHADSGESSGSDDPSSTTPETTADSNAENEQDRYVIAHTAAGPSKVSRKWSKSSRVATAKNGQKRLWKSIEKGEDKDSTDEELGFLPENSKEKGKGRAIRKVKRPRKQIAEVSSDEEDDQEEDEEQMQAAVGEPPARSGFAKSSNPTIHSMAFADDDSDIEILEYKSTPVGVKAEFTMSHKCRGYQQNADFMLQDYDA
ncbi:hypothetical protein ONS95_011120 [Cadophora gregata]|uniref:uncharacterized protein n=1 Tax=Cadophora gregata TaxID=51156 RepID=UPI0026DAEB83|nr:uncharacterized protein ONS95_011120 [Cadophora gregata]KAK0119684.1 hypothetical protein ONS95_011120 [Cadophora gregata]